MLSQLLIGLVVLAAIALSALLGAIAGTRLLPHLHPILTALVQITVFFAWAIGSVMLLSAILNAIDPAVYSQNADSAIGVLTVLVDNAGEAFKHKGTSLIGGIVCAIAFTVMAQIRLARHHKAQNA